MNWNAFATSLVMIFLAEFGDKTQLAAISMVTKFKSPYEVFLGTITAMTVVTLLGVKFGEFITGLVPATYIQGFAGILFIAIGFLMLFRVF